MKYKGTKFFNTGYIPEDANIKREKQGISSQFISNTCVFYMKKNNEMDLPSFNTLFYPVKATPLPDYDLKPISNNYPCVRYVQYP